LKKNLFERKNNSNFFYQKDIKTQIKLSELRIELQKSGVLIFFIDKISKWNIEIGSDNRAKLEIRIRG